MNYFNNFTECYIALADQVLNQPDFVSSPRGKKIREKLAVKFMITNPRSRILYSKPRKFSVQYLIAELLWYLSGENSTEWISNYSSFWKTISDDGHTANSAYGSRIFKPHPRIAGGKLTQWDYVIQELIEDPDSRRGIIHIRTPEDSIYAKLDVPCTLSLQFFIREAELHLIVNMRSSDLILGIAYDVPAFTFMQEMMANQLGVGLGTYTHISNSLHIYENHIPMAATIIGEDNITQSSMYQISRGEMPKIPLDIPLQELYLFEKELRKSITEQQIDLLLDELSCLDSEGLDFWLDWGKILASHRLKKMGLEHQSKTKLNSTSFVGYHEL